MFAAATGVHKPLEQLTTRHFDWTFALNVRAFFDLVRRLSPAMPSGSAIVAVSSEGAEHVMPSYTLVGASKGALEALARLAAAEVGHARGPDLLILEGRKESPRDLPRPALRETLTQPTERLALAKQAIEGKVAGGEPAPLGLHRDSGGCAIDLHPVRQRGP